MGILDALKGNGKPKITVTGINLKLHGRMHTLDGIEVKERQFTIDIPFKNKTHSDMLTDAALLKVEKAKILGIKAIEVADPFKLVSVNPRPPIELKADEQVDFRIVLEAPDVSYTGPITISFVSDNVETIHVEITKSVLVAKGSKIPIETSSRILNIQKGSIFSEKVQLYKALSYGDTIKNISIAKPFRFVSSEPKLPLKVSDPNSYIVNLYIQAPDISYSGELEIELN